MTDERSVHDESDERVRPSVDDTERSIPIAEGAILQLGPFPFSTYERWRVTKIDGDDLHFEYRVGRGQYQDADGPRDVDTIVQKIDEGEIDIVQSEGALEDLNRDGSEDARRASARTTAEGDR